MSKPTETPPHRDKQEAAPITQAAILIFFLPLAASWLLMGVEFPVIVAFVTRLPDEVVNIAALGIVLVLSLWIETPVIGLLSTGTTLAKNRQHYLLLRRFTVHLMIGVTVVHALVAWTPLYWVLMHQVLGVPEAVAEAALPGMRIMTTWSAAIAWRRFTQGVMIRYQQTWVVGVGTAVRLATVVIASGAGLALRLPGVWIGSIAWVAGVTTEALFVHVAARRTLRLKFGPGVPSDGEPPLTYGSLCRFHLPLTLTMMLFFVGPPVIRAAISRGQDPDPTATLAAWEAVTLILFFHRAPALALPEAIIALQKNAATARALFRFSIGVGLAATASLLAVTLTPLGGVLLTGALGVPAHVTEVAVFGLVATLLVPMLSAAQSYYKGLLTAQRLTLVLTWAMVLHMGCLVGFLAAGRALGWPGVINAAVSITAALTIELAYLRTAWTRAARRLSVPA
ncbi:MAG: hypothetical protein IH851_11395 [Armatimonadetes bacterium]|nr:hypothetical protein [Armatimonadota bacterium]